MKKLLTVLVLCFGLIHANDIIHVQTFPWMTVSYIGEATVFNTTCDKLEYEDPFYHAQGDTSEFLKVMEYIPNEKTGELYSIIFSMGEAGNSRYEFYREGNAVKLAYVIHCDHLEFLGNGKIIARGSMNEMFIRSRVFQLNKYSMKEKPQPYYSINMKSVAEKDFKIYLNKNPKIVIDEIKKNDVLDVLLAEFKENYKYYLIRSKRGLCGWIRIDKGTWIDQSPIKDIYCHGD